MQVHYLGGLRTEATHFDSGIKIITDAPKDNHGKGEAFSPTDLLSTSLASCKLTIMAIKAKSMGIELDGVKVLVKKVMTTEAPRKVAEVVLTFEWNGVDQKITPEQMESLKRSAAMCPVALSLDPSVKKTVHW